MGVLTALTLIVAMAAPPTASVAAAAPVSPAPTAHTIGLRLLDVPAANDDPRAQVYVVDHLAPGATIQRRIEISAAGAAARVTLYAGSATIAGGSFVGAAGHTPNDLSTWTSVSPGSIDVPANEQMNATVSIGVPQDAAPGERYGVVWAEVSAPPAAGGGVIEVSRVGIRLYISVGPGGPPEANFTIDSLTAERAADGAPIVVASVRNTGGRALDMSGSLQLLSGPGGLRAGPFPAALGTTLAVGDTEPVTIAMDPQVPAGPWDAQLSLHSGLLERHARGTMTFPSFGAAPSVRPSTAGPRSLYVPIAVLVVLVGGTTATVVRRRRTRS